MRHAMRATTVVVAAWGATAAALGAVPATNGLMLWLDSSDGSTVSTNGSGGVLAWGNKAASGLGGVAWSGANDNGTSAAFNADPPAYVAGPNGVGVVDFTRDGYLSNLAFGATPRLNLTVFILAAVDSNPGAYSAVLAARQSGTVNDYQTGINIDQGEPASATFTRINVEGAKAGGGGGFDLLNDPLAFGQFHLFEIGYGGGAAGQDRTVSVSVNGTVRGTLVGAPNLVNLNQLFVGTRAYASGGVPTANHDLDGRIAAVLIYDGQLAGAELAQTRAYLNTFFQVYADGDFNRDGAIDGVDLSILNNGFAHGLGGYENGDFDRDGVIGRDDYAKFDRARALYSAPGAVMGVPEPGAGGVIVVGGAAVVGWGRRGRKVSC